jgi:hypothetical protein
VSLDNELLFAGILLEAGILALLIRRHTWKTLPFFFAYIIWGLFSDGINYFVERHSAGLTSSGYLRTYLFLTVFDTALQFCVIVELSWSILRPLRKSLSYRALILVAILILIAGGVIWPFAGVHGLEKYPLMQGLLRLQETTSILRILFFLFLAASSQLLSIGWRDRELQIATGLGFYSLVSLAVDILRRHQEVGPMYNVLERIAVSSYFCTLLYWGLSFAQKDAVRQEFTPQMQGFLLAVAGGARSARISLSDHKSDENDNSPK